MTINEEKRNLILTGKPYELVWKMSLPAVVGMIVVALYSFVDSIFVGQMVNGYAMTAISIAYPFTLLNSGVAVLVGIGSASILSRAIGRNDQNTANKIMPNLLAMTILLSIIITAIMEIFTRPILSISGAEGEVLEYSISYARIIFLGSFFINFAQSTNMLIRGEGALKNAMILMGFGAVLNIILDPVLIIAFGSNGLEGAAVATLISQIALATATFWYFKKRTGGVRINKVKFEKSIMKEVTAVGISAMLMQVLTLVQQTLFLWSASKYGGEDFQMIASVVLRTMAFAFIPLWGVSQGFQPVVGTNYGARQYDRVKKCTSAFIVAATLVALLFYVPLMAFPEQIISLFITDTNIALQGINSFRIAFAPFFVLGLMIIVITYLQATGDAKTAILLTVFRQIFLYIPLIIVVPLMITPSVEGVFIAATLTESIIAVACVIIILSKFKQLKINFHTNGQNPKNS